jgi:hypothetical protein
MLITDPNLWANTLFAHAKLNDPRRTRRLVRISASLAQHVGQSIMQSARSPADMEAAYRFMRNSAIRAEHIDDAGFASTADMAAQFNILLALEDTTSLNFSYPSIRDDLGHISTTQQARGLQAHSVLLYAPEAVQLVGLIAQQRWTRDITTMGKNRRATQTPYQAKESYKWEQTSRQMAERLGPLMQRVISVCDREADLIEYLAYKHQQGQRFIVRSAKSRRIEEADSKLYAFGCELAVAGERSVNVPQKGGRKARQVQCDIRYAPVTIKVPTNKQGESISLFYVSCIEQGSPDGLSWHLLTSEPVTNAKQAQQIVMHYEKRWLIEDFHKAWKSSGTRVEALRLQTRANLEKAVVILSFVAVRIQQLRFTGLQDDRGSQVSCESLFTPLEWKILWRKVEKKKLPVKAPSMRWFYLSLGKLGGWKDTKRTGRVGWEVLWEGWFVLQSILEGYVLALSLEHDL